MEEDFFDDAVAHTLAKHKILEEYLKRWLPILGRGQSNRLLYFDGFAGCGELDKGQPGSPLVAIRTAVQGVSRVNKVRLEVKMVEFKAARCRHLKALVERERVELASMNQQIKIDDPVCGDCETEVSALLDRDAKTGQPLGPAFFFLDQYGYSGFSMDLVRRILSHGKCETFAYLNWQRMHPYFTDPTKAEPLTRALGGDEWREVQPLRDQARADRFKQIYLAALRTRANARYIYDFAMRGSDHRLIYWLFFCTNSLKGLEEMKNAMWKVDPTGRFEFSDRDADQGMLMTYTQAMLANDLDSKLRGRELTAKQLKEHVLTQTPEYRYSKAIKILKEKDIVTPELRNGKAIYKFAPTTAITGGLFD